MSSAIKAGEAYVEFSARDQQLKNALEANKQRMQGFVRHVAAVGTAAAAAGLAVAIKAASDTEEVLNKFNVVFGENQEAVKRWADTFAAEVGRSKRQVAEFLANTQDLLIPVGIDPAAAEQMSKDITRLTVDVASFNNKLDTDVMRDFHAALTGGGETVKKYGIVLDVAATNARLLQEGIDPAQATNAQKVWARWQVILDGTTAAQGDAVRSGDSFANQSKRLQGQLEDTAAALGEVFLPIATDLVEMLNAGLKPLGEWVTDNKELVATIGKTAFTIGLVVGAVKALNTALMIYSIVATRAQAKTPVIGWITLAVGAGIAAISVNEISDAIGDAEKASREAADALNELEQAVDGVNKQAEIDVRAKNIDELETRIMNLSRRIEDLRNLGREDLVAPVARQMQAAQDQLLGMMLPEDAGLDEKVLNQFNRALESTREEITKIKYGLTDAELALNKFVAEGIDEDQFKKMRAALDELNGLKAADEERKRLEQEEKQQNVADQQRAEQIRDALRTPQEAFQDMVDGLHSLVEKELLSAGEAQAYIKSKADEAFDESQQRTFALGSQLAQESSQDLRTAEGSRQLIALMNGAGDIEQRQLHVQKNMEKLLAKIESKEGDSETI